MRSKFCFVKQSGLLNYQLIHSDVLFHVDGMKIMLSKYKTDISKINFFFYFNCYNPNRPI